MQCPQRIQRPLAFGLLIAGCAAPKSAALQPESSAAVAQEALDPGVVQLPRSAAPGEVPAAELGLRWTSEDVLSFEARVARLAAGPGAHWSDPDLTTLAASLQEEGSPATRAAVLLSFDPRPQASEILIQSLEARHVASSRGLDAGDIIAATALGQRQLEDDASSRLLALVSGSQPHPDLEVRVECAAALLDNGWADDGVAAFLIRVLRAETPAQASDPIDWERVETLSWAKSRSAAALTRHLNTPNEFHPDAPWKQQMDLAAAWEAALQ